MPYGKASARVAHRLDDKRLERAEHAAAQSFETSERNEAAAVDDESGFARVSGHEIPGAHLAGVRELAENIYEDFDYSSIPDETFDVVTMLDVVEHVRDPKFLLSQCHRILRPGGFGFCHHSNFGTLAVDKESNWLKNPAWRSTMTAELFRDYCREVGLVVETQKLTPWFNIINLDCISTFRKPSA